jgi:hypothetical protein
MSGNSVFMIGWEYPPNNSGGLGVACQGLTQALSAEGEQIYFTLPYHLSRAQGHMQVIECFDQDWFLHGDSQAPPFAAYGQQPMMIAKDLTVDELRALPQSELELRVTQYADLVTDAAVVVDDQADLIHAHDWMSFPAAAQIKQELGKPFIAHVHSTEFDRIPTGHGSHYIHQAELYGLQLADKIIAVSNYTKQIIVSKYGIDPGKIAVVYNGVEPIARSAQRQPTFAADRPVIVFMGRLTMQKGAEYFLQLAKKVLRELPDALFIVAGSGDQYTSLLLQNADLNLSAHVLFTGFIRGKSRDQLLQRADVFVMPSLSEPFGLVALEAAQYDTPVLVSQNSGVSEVMPGAKIIDFWDVDKMTAEISHLIQDKKHHSQTVKAQHRDVQNLTWNRAAKNIKHLYRQVFLGRPDA